ncbi:MAG: sigma 54-interacting transcriptional regulator [Nitrospirota bacterium]|nr:sigma 54-interacting transcriptional regulator [Nitrospirota bacterium]
MGPHHIVIMDCEPHACAAGQHDRLPLLLKQTFPSAQVDIHTVPSSAPQGMSLRTDLVLLHQGSTVSVAESLSMLRQGSRYVPVLGLFCARYDPPQDVATFLQHGMDDFLFCPFRDIELRPRVQRFLQHEPGHVLGRSEDLPPAPRFRHESLVGESVCFQQALEKVSQFACSDATALILGETGTGKELFARAIHYHGPRKGKPFIPVNCGALPDQLLENELFGHMRGAFTDAFCQQDGLVAEAEGGTLFLDEIETLSLPAQTKLLRFLQDRAYRPLGMPKGKIADVRIIAATNADLQQRVAEKHFREDLYYRLNILSLSVPSLRERIEYIPLLATHFLQRYNRPQGNGPMYLSSAALQKLLAHSWPGNVRELESVMQRALLSASSGTLQPDDLDVPLPYPKITSVVVSLRQAKDCAVREFERTYLTTLLAASRGNVTHAAKAAGRSDALFNGCFASMAWIGTYFTNCPNRSAVIDLYALPRGKKTAVTAAALPHRYPFVFPRSIAFCTYKQSGQVSRTPFAHSEKSSRN